MFWGLVSLLSPHLCVERACQDSSPERARRAAPCTRTAADHQISTCRAELRQAQPRVRWCGRASTGSRWRSDLGSQRWQSFYRHSGKWPEVFEMGAQAGMAATLGLQVITLEAPRATMARCRPPCAPWLAWTGKSDERQGQQYPSTGGDRTPRAASGRCQSDHGLTLRSPGSRAARFKGSATRAGDAALESTSMGSCYF